MEEVSDGCAVGQAMVAVQWWLEAMDVYVTDRDGCGVRWW